MKRLVTSRLMKIYTVTACCSSLSVRLISLFAAMGVSKFKEEKSVAETHG